MLLIIVMSEPKQDIPEVVKEFLTDLKNLVDSADYIVGGIDPPDPRSNSFTVDDGSVITCYGHDVQEGDKIVVTMNDYRRWPRFWCWLRRKPAPTITEERVVGSVAKSTLTYDLDS